MSCQVGIEPEGMGLGVGLMAGWEVQMESRVCCVLAPCQELSQNKNLTGSGSKYRENTLKIEA